MKKFLRNIYSACNNGIKQKNRNRTGNMRKYTQQDRENPSPEKIEHGGMIFVLCFGLLLFIGGLLLTWQIGAFDDKYFFGYDIDYHDRTHKTERTISGLLHLPWFTGALMIAASVKYFWGKRKKQY